MGELDYLYVYVLSSSVDEPCLSSSYESMSNHRGKAGSQRRTGLIKRAESFCRTPGGLRWVCICASSTPQGIVTKRFCEFYGGKTTLVCCLCKSRNQEKAHTTCVAFVHVQVQHHGPALKVNCRLNNSVKTE